MWVCEYLGLTNRFIVSRATKQADAKTIVRTY